MEHTIETRIKTLRAVRPEKKPYINVSELGKVSYCVIEFGNKQIPDMKRVSAIATTIALGTSSAVAEERHTFSDVSIRMDPSV